VHSDISVLLVQAAPKRAHFPYDAGTVEHFRRLLASQLGMPGTNQDAAARHGMRAGATTKEAAMGLTPESHEPEEGTPRLTGNPVLDASLEKVGTVTDVLFDDGDNAPRWAVVKTGFLGGEHFVPLDETYLDENGRLVVPLTKMTIRHAPRARRDHILTLQARRELRDYYGIAA